MTEIVAQRMGSFSVNDVSHGSTRRWIGGLLVLTLLAGALWQLGQGTAVLVKAQLAQILIERSWQSNREQGRISARPWSWADTSPVAKLRFVRQDKELMVLSGDSGRVLAFGPGHSASTPLPASGGNSVISGHRDTHFAVLRHLRPGDQITIENTGGDVASYQVSHTRVVHMSELSVMRDNGIDELTLVTCWPFDALEPNGPDRFVVSAYRGH